MLLVDSVPASSILGKPISMKDCAFLMLRNEAQPLQLSAPGRADVQDRTARHARCHQKIATETPAQPHGLIEIDLRVSIRRAMNNALADIGLALGRRASGPGPDDLSQPR